MLWGNGNLLSLLNGDNYFSFFVCTFPLWSYQMYIYSLNQVTHVSWSKQTCCIMAVL